MRVCGQKVYVSARARAGAYSASAIFDGACLRSKRKQSVARRVLLKSWMETAAWRKPTAWSQSQRCPGASEKS